MSDTTASPVRKKDKIPTGIKGDTTSKCQIQRIANIPPKKDVHYTKEQWSRYQWNIECL